MTNQPTDPALIVKTEPGVLSFPKLFDPEPVDLKGRKLWREQTAAGQPVTVPLFYQTAFILHQDPGPLNAALKAAALGKWGANVPLGLRIAMNKCDESRHYAQAFPGLVYINLKSNKPIPLVDRDNVPITQKDDPRVYPGVWARAFLQAYAWDNDWGKGVSLGVRAIQIVRDGTPLAGAPVDATRVFEPVPLTPEELAQVTATGAAPPPAVAAVAAPAAAPLSGQAAIDEMFS